MTEILTESFCERCGSRYTFESSAPRKSRAGRLKVFSKGVRNFVLTDDSSFSEAMAEARSEEEQVATVHQLDAFHKTFSFCMGCRQYTCGSCWNTGEGRCLTCAPDPALEAAAAAEVLAAEGSAEPIALAAETIGVGQIAAEAEIAAPLETLERVEDDSPPAPASIQGVVSGQTLEEAIAAWEAQQSEEGAPVDAAAKPEPVAASAPEAVPHADDVVPQPTWPTAATAAQPVAPTVPTEPVPAVPAPWLTIAPDDAAPEPQWPTTPAWPQPGPHQHVPTTLAGRPLLPQGDVAALWAASAREVLSAAPASLPAAAAAPTAQPCVACGLSLSANARFCRRCGSRQT